MTMFNETLGTEKASVFLPLRCVTVCPLGKVLHTKLDSHHRPKAGRFPGELADLALWLVVGKLIELPA